MKAEFKVKVFRALADETRFEIMRTIAVRGEVPCAELVEEFSLSRPALSHHFRILKEARLVKARKSGQFYFFSLNQSFLRQLGPYFIEVLKK